MTFAPKFVDLVRNYTTTTGTDDFAVGPAVNGYASFIDMCATGDTFYYSATNLDTPGEHEVGRGTLAADGTISRDPINGSKTVFSGGTKSVALITAAEWYAAVDLLRSSPVNVKAFGAKGDASDDGSTGTDDTAAIQAALDHLGSRGGGALYLPEGNYLVSAALNVPNFTVLKGAGRRASKLVGVHAGGGGATASESVLNGTILSNAQPINTSPGAHIAIYNLWVHNANGDNEGAGFYLQSGDSVLIRDCEFTGSKWGVILDQSEDVSIEGSLLASWVADGAALWIVNGQDLTPGASGGFSNIINVRDCQINVLPGSYGVIDDGGYEHSFSGCNFVCGTNAIRAAGVNGLVLESPYCESQLGDIIHLDSLSLAGNFVGGSTTTIIGGQFSPTPGNACIKGFNAGGTVTVIGGQYSSPQMPPLASAGTFWAIAIIHPSMSSGYPEQSQFCDGNAIAHHFESVRVRAGIDGKVGVPNYPGVTGGITFTPGAKAGFVETFNSSGARQGYGFLLNGSALQFGAEGAAASFQFLSPVTCTGAVTSSGGGIGYSAGAGGTVTQGTSKSTGVTLNKLSGQITLAADALAPGATVSFKLTNSQLSAGDVLILNHVSGGTIGAYRLNAHGAAAGSVTIDVTNAGAASLSEAITIGFAVMKAVTA